MNKNFVVLSKLLNSQRQRELPVAVDCGKTYSWEEFLAKVQGLCAEFSADPSPEWILYCQNSLTFAMGFLALMQAGKTIVLPQNIQEGYLRDMGITDTKILTDKPVKNSPYTMITLNLDNISKIPFETKEVDPEKVRVKIFTSGSSGRPKQVVKRLTQLEVEVCELEKAWGDVLGDSVYCATVVHQHIYGLLFRILWPLCRGSVLSAQLITTPEELSPLYKENEKIALISSPAFLKRLQTLDKKELFKEKKFTVFSSGGVLEKDTAEEMSRVFSSYPQEVLGSTETGGVAYRTQENSNAAWKPFDVVETKLDKEGQLLIKSPYTDVEGFLPMGDTAEFLKDGKSFLLKGRIDKVVKIEEKRVSLTEIEARLNEHPLVDKALAIAIRNKRQMIGVALVLNKKGKKEFKGLEKKEINTRFRDYLLQYFEPVILPRKWRYIDSVPTNAQGKVMAQDLAALFA